MPCKKKKYNSRFPPTRIKKIMQADEEVGKVAAVVPIIISRVLEIFVENLLKDSCKITKQRNARTLTPAHIKASVLQNSQLDFLKEIVSLIPDHQQGSNDDEQIDYSQLNNNYANFYPSINSNNNNHRSFVKQFSHPVSSSSSLPSSSLSSSNQLIVENSNRQQSLQTQSLQQSQSLQQQPQSLQQQQQSLQSQQPQFVLPQVPINKVTSNNNKRFSRSHSTPCTTNEFNQQHKRAKLKKHLQQQRQQKDEDDLEEEEDDDEDDDDDYDMEEDGKESLSDEEVFTGARPLNSSNTATSTTTTRTVGSSTNQPLSLPHNELPSTSMMNAPENSSNEVGNRVMRKQLEEDDNYDI